MIIIVFIITYFFRVLSHQRSLIVFHWSLSDSKSPQVSRTLLSILTVFNNAVVLIVPTRPPTTNSSSPFNNALVTMPNALITIGIIGMIVTFMFHSFFNSHSKLKVLILLFTFFQFYSVISRDSKVYNFPSSLFLLITNIIIIIIMSCRHFSLSFIASGRSSGLHPVSSHSCCM